jgi:hypothetical protein
LVTVEVAGGDAAVAVGQEPGQGRRQAEAEQGVAVRRLGEVAVGDRSAGDPSDLGRQLGHREGGVAGQLVRPAGVTITEQHGGGGLGVVATSRGRDLAATRGAEDRAVGQGRA